jgi:hypothetical protein
MTASALPAWESVVSEPGPQAAPLTYPGQAPDRAAVLLLGRSLLDIRPARAPLGDWAIAYNGTQRTLDDVLAAEAATVTGERVPVLAVGSNASPAQLYRKFTAVGVRPVVPLTAVKVPGIGVGVSAHVSKPGYLPATPVPDPGTTSDLFITWLDQRQIAAMDRTEPNYRREMLPPRYPVHFCHGPAVTGCWIYVSKHGCITGPDGTPRPLQPQETMIAALLGEIPWLATVVGSSPAEWVLRCQFAQTRDEVRAVLREAGRVDVPVF